MADNGSVSARLILCAAVVVFSAISVVPTSSAEALRPKPGHRTGTIDLPLGPSPAYFVVDAYHDVEDFRCCGTSPKEDGRMRNGLVVFHGTLMRLQAHLVDERHLVGDGRWYLWGMWFHVTWRAHWTHA
jgi:hypothetical protein